MTFCQVIHLRKSNWLPRGWLRNKTELNREAELHEVSLGMHRAWVYFSLLRSVPPPPCLGIVTRVFPALPAAFVGVFISSCVRWQGCGYLSRQTACFRARTDRFWLEVAMPAEVEQVWLRSRCRGERRGWCSSPARRRAVSLGLNGSGAHLWWESCGMAETPFLRLSGAGRDGGVGEPSPPGSHCSLRTQPEIKAHLARAGAGCVPWQTSFVLSS